MKTPLRCDSPAVRLKGGGATSCLQGVCCRKSSGKECCSATGCHLTSGSAPAGPAQGSGAHCPQRECYAERLLGPTPVSLFWACMASGGLRARVEPLGVTVSPLKLWRKSPHHARNNWEPSMEITVTPLPPQGGHPYAHLHIGNVGTVPGAVDRLGWEPRAPCRAAQPEEACTWLRASPGALPACLSRRFFCSSSIQEVQRALGALSSPPSRAMLHASFECPQPLHLSLVAPCPAQ